MTNDPAEGGRIRLADNNMTSMHAPRTANEVDMHVGKRIRERRQDLKMSQEKLGNSLGVTFQQVQKYERGTNRIGASRLFKLSQVMEVPIRYFYSGLAGVVQSEVAEGEQPPLHYDVLNTPEGAELAEAFSRIKSKAVREQVLQLARTLAANEKD